MSFIPPAEPNPDLLVGLDTSDDAGVYRLTKDLAIVQTVDYFTPIVDNPYHFGQIAATNALSDIYAMGGTPITVLNLVGFPISKLDKAILAQILRGGADKVREAGATLVGGHSIDDGDPKFGMAVTGIIHPDQIWTNAGAKDGDALILTKPIGMGITSKAIKEGLASADDISEAVHWMSMLNKYAAEIAHNYPVHAVTDVTGFGLLGHAFEMIQGSGLSLNLFAKNIPMLAGVRNYAEKGLIPSGSKRNLAYVKAALDVVGPFDDILYAILADAVTSGGLLIALPQANADLLLRDLQAKGMEQSALIGEFTASASGRIRVIRN